MKKSLWLEMCESVCVSPQPVLAMDVDGQCWGAAAAPLLHLHLLPLPLPLHPLVVVVDGEDPEASVVPHAALPPGRVTVRSYHRLGGVWRLEIIRHGPAGGAGGELLGWHSHTYLVTWFMWSASCLSPPRTLCLVTLCLVSLRQQVLPMSTVNTRLTEGGTHLNTRPTMIIMMREMTTMRVSLYIRWCILVGMSS